MTDKVLYELQDVSRIYRGKGPPRAALTRVSLRLSRGEFVALVGPSGSGKTTLLSLLGGLDVDYEGSVKLDGNEIKQLDDSGRARLRGERIGFVFQSFHLLPHLSLLENVCVPWLFADEPATPRHLAAAESALEKVGLLDRRSDRPTQLSGGQRQRVAIARALVRSPSVLLCDEPTGNLDQGTGREIRELLQTLHRTGVTVVVVTHEPSLAAAAERRVALVDGRLEPATEALGGTGAAAPPPHEEEHEKSE
jgi:ABC-type lipoprotein export system ATPase subunit